MFQYTEHVFNLFPEYREISVPLYNESRRRGALFYLRWNFRPCPNCVLSLIYSSFVHVGNDFMFTKLFICKPFAKHIKVTAKGVEKFKLQIEFCTE
jgi:hypothetical protein